MHKKILLIEDDEGLAELYRFQMIRSGLEVSVEHDGQSGLDRVLTEPFDLVVVDLMLPKLDGLSVVDSIRKSSRIKGLPIIMLSNLEEDSTIEHALSLGINGYFVKSQITPDQLSQEVLKYVS